MSQTVVGFFDNAADAQRAVEKLVNDGFDRSQVDVSSGMGNSTTTSGDRDTNDHENGITRFFKNLFGDNDEADRYSRVGMRSNSIVTVHAQSSDDAERAADLLDDYGAINVNERASEYDTTGTTAGTMADYDRTNVSDYDGTNVSDRDRVMDTDRTTDADRTTGPDYDENRAYSDSDTSRRNMSGKSDRDTTFNRIEENLEVGKRTVERGGVRVRSRIVEKPVEENVRLREEHVNVERNPVDRAANRDELENFKERDIELTERAEVPVVNKEARVVEEIRVSKDVNEREETVRDTVRHTEVDVDKLKDKDLRNTRDNDYNDDVRDRDRRVD